MDTPDTNINQKSREDLILLLEKAQSEEQQAKAALKELRTKILSGYRQVHARPGDLQECPPVTEEELASFKPELIDQIFEELSKSLQTNASLRQQCFGSGNDLSKSAGTAGADTADNAGASEPAGDSQENKSRLKTSLKAALSSTNKALRQINDCFEKMTQEEVQNLPEKVRKALEVIHTETSEQKNKDTQTAPQGKQRKEREDAEFFQAEFDPNAVCPHCGKPLEDSQAGKTIFGKLIYRLTLLENLVTTSPQAKNLLKARKNEQHIKICPHCGELNLAFNPDMAVPVSPFSSVMTDYTRELMLCQEMGVPITRRLGAPFSRLGIGTNTLYYALDDYTDGYIKPLFNIIVRTAKNAPILLADGTPVKCLETERTDGTKKSYIIVLCSAPLEEKQFVVFGFAKNRSTESIGKVITQDYQFSFLVVDAYGGYRALLKERNSEAKLQICVVHFRRAVIRALAPEDLQKELDAMSDEQLEEWARAHMTKGSRFALFILVLRLISYLFGWEQTICPNEPGADERGAESLKHRKVIIDTIGSCMKEVSEGLIEETKTGKYKIIKAGDPYAQACLYYANNEEAIRTFLENYKIPMDTNPAENTIRRFAFIRNAAYWIGSEKSAENLVMRFTVVRTLRMNGYDPRIFLLGYERALYHYCLQKAKKLEYEENFRDDAVLNRRPKHWNMEELSEGFDFEAFNPTVPARPPIPAEPQ